MTLNHSTALRNYALDSGFGPAFDTDGRIAIYTGSQPANADSDVGTSTLLGTLTLPADVFGAAASGHVIANAISSVSAVAAGTAAWFRMYKNVDGPGGASTTKRRLDGSVSLVGAGGDLQFDITAFVVGGTIAVTSFQYNYPT